VLPNQPPGKRMPRYDPEKFRSGPVDRIAHMKGMLRRMQGQGISAERAFLEAAVKMNAQPTGPH